MSFEASARHTSANRKYSYPRLGLHCILTATASLMDAPSELEASWLQIRSGLHGIMALYCAEELCGVTVSAWTSPFTV